MKKRSLLIVPALLTPLVLVLTAFCVLMSPGIGFAQWEPDVRLTFADSFSALQPACMRALAVGPTGTLHVVWTDNRDGNTEIYYKHSTDHGTTWSADSRMTNDPQISTSPSVSTSGEEVNVVWSDERQGQGWPEVFFKQSTDGGLNWGPDTRLAENATDALCPSSASWGPNIYVLFWDDTGLPRIYYKHSTDHGTTWSADSILSNSTGGFPISALAVSDSVVYAFWTRLSPRQVYFRRSTDAGGTWAPEARLTANTSGTQTFPSVSASGPDVHLVWHSSTGSTMAVFYKRSTDYGVTWTPDTLLTLTPARAMYPSVSSSGARVGVSWQGDSLTSGGYGRNYYKASTDHGATWSPDTCLSGDFLSYPSSPFPCIALDGAAKHLVWEDGLGLGGGNYEIYYKRDLGNISGAWEDLSSRPAPWPTRLTVFPNPFVSFAAIPGHSSDRFALYDVSGRIVGTYRGNRIGSDLSTGVYFLKVASGDSRPVRIVKVR